MDHFSPKQICAALGDINAVTLRGWHNLSGLAVGEQSPSGHRRYSLSDVASIDFVRQMARPEGSGVLQLPAAIAIANALAPFLARLHQEFRTQHQTEWLKELRAADPKAVCRREAGQWAIRVYAERADWVRDVLGGGTGHVVLVDAATLLRSALARMSRHDVAGLSGDAD